MNADTIPPTAYVTSRSPFTNASDVSVRILFSEPCSGGGGFVCNDSDCNVSRIMKQFKLFQLLLNSIWQVHSIKPCVTV